MSGVWQNYFRIVILLLLLPDIWGQFYQCVNKQLFTHADPLSAKSLTVFFALLGSACVKAARKMLVKLTPNVRGLAKLLSYC